MLHGCLSSCPIRDTRPNGYEILILLREVMAFRWDHSLQYPSHAFPPMLVVFFLCKCNSHFSFICSFVEINRCTAMQTCTGSAMASTHQRCACVFVCCCCCAFYSFAIGQILGIQCYTIQYDKLTR